MSYMRYMMLFVCFMLGTMAYGYNEVIPAVAYNPSLLGGYEYLKVLQKATFVGGLGVANNKAEINFGGQLTVQDNHPDQHRYTKAVSGYQMHRINQVMSLNNYILDSSDTNITFCKEDSRWPQNLNACGTDTDRHFQSENAWLMGKVDSPSFWTGFDAITNDPAAGESLVGTAYVPLVKTYGGSIQAGFSSSPKTGYSIIQKIQGIRFLGSAFEYSESVPSNYVISTSSPTAIPGMMPITITAKQVKGRTSTSKLYATTVILADAILDFAKMRCPSGSPSYSWQTITDADNIPIKVLKRECN